jgi:palmitoyl-protein thioesterase
LTDASLAGDHYSSPGMLEFASLIKDIYPGIFVHSVYIDQDQDKDTRAGFVRFLQQQNDTLAYIGQVLSMEM